VRQVLKLVKPQHFLPVHGEYAFLCAHSELAQESGVQYTKVIRNGQMLGVHDRRNGRVTNLPPSCLPACLSVWLFA
jgi:mRNA degradation ribonuclease J1/J2